MRILGIDPGIVGGVAVLITGSDLDGHARVLAATDVPTRGEDAKRRVDVLRLAQWISAHGPDVAFIERAGVMPHQHPHSGFLYGRSVGALEAATVLAHVPLHVIEPSVWKRAFGLKGNDKESSRRAVISVLPAAVQFLEFKKHHHRAEAILLAMYGADLIANGFQWDNLRESAA